MKMKLTDLTRGKTFHYAGFDWITLGAENGGTLAVMADILKLAPFDEDGSADWRAASSRKYLNGDFYEELKEADPDNGAAIMEATINLTADDGTNRVTSTDRVFLLTAEQYRYNRDVLEPLSEWWWTLTRWSASNSCRVRLVYSGGTLVSNSACNGLYGLRPALLLASDLLISVDEPGEDTSAEDKLTPEEAGEIMRDMANTFGVPGGVTSDELAAGVGSLQLVDHVAEERVVADKAGEADAAVVRPQRKPGIRRSLVLVRDPADNGADVLLAGAGRDHGLQIERIRHLLLGRILELLDLHGHRLAESVGRCGCSGPLLVLRLVPLRVLSPGTGIYADDLEAAEVHKTAGGAGVPSHVCHRQLAPGPLRYLHIRGPQLGRDGDGHRRGRLLLLLEQIKKSHVDLLLWLA